MHIMLQLLTILPVIVFLVALVLVYRRLPIKFKKFIMLLLLVFIYLAIPYCLNYAIFNKGWKLFDAPRELGTGEWYIFIVGYLGNIGTIFFGWIAFWQTELIERQNQIDQKQQEQLQALQELVAKHQVLPNIRFGQLAVTFYHQSSRIQEGRERVEEIEFKQFGSTDYQYGETYIIIGINLQQKGLIPAAGCCIEKIVWRIAGKEYQIALPKHYRSLYVAEHVDIVLSQKELKEEALLLDLIDHFKYQNHKRVKYDRSEMELHFKIWNDVSAQMPYTVLYRIDTKDKLDGQVSATVPHIKRK